MRPKGPRNLEFVLDESQFPDKFLRKNIHVGSTRHIVLATEKQLEVLVRAKIWYQLFSIHAFVKNDEYEPKQLPLAFDFEAAFLCVYQGVPIHGCAFHLGMVLPFLSAEHIAPMIPLLCSRVDYVESTWTKTLHSQLTRGLCSGWHRKISAKAGKASLPFFVLVSLLYDESNSVETQIQLKTNLQMQARLFSVWEEYQNGVISSSKLLKRCSSIHGPTME
ncbi:hypothetical protein ACJMK2_044005 [Sinanodonta woodiana]|uniref:Uncharacterized protein n=1 Tax=Sinanodonta woodiana TaxID=1069815 RepID=A0ABD3VYP5_SINWO